jgi:hypothetical protein
MDLDVAGQRLAVKWDARARARWARGVFIDGADKQQAMVESGRGNR